MITWLKYMSTDSVDKNQSPITNLLSNYNDDYSNLIRW